MRLLAVLRAVVEPAEQPDFLGAEPDDADGAKRPAGIHDPFCRGGGDRDPGGIVDCAGALVPAVEMPADQDRRQRWVAAWDFGNHIAGLARAEFAAVQHQLHPDRLAALQDALELLGVGDRQRAGRDRLRAVVEAHARRCAGCGDGRCRSSGRQSPARPSGWRWSGLAGAARRTGHSPIRPAFAGIAMIDEHDLAPDRFIGGGRSASTLSKATISPRRSPSARSTPLLPSAATTIGWGKGARISALSCPRTQTGMSNGSTRTLAKPIAVSFLTAHPALALRLRSRRGAGRPRWSSPSVISHA